MAIHRRLRLHHWITALLLVLLSLVILAMLGAWLLLHGNLPRTTGALDLPALDAPVEVARDAHGIPTIRAGSTRDAYLALGFVHAQDRFQQMEFMRRLGEGRLAEVIGEGAVGMDRWSRTLGLHRRAQQSYRALGDEARAALDAYAAGVNAWLRRRDSWLPPPLTLLDVRPDPWTPADSLVWQRLMAFRLAGNWQDEAARARLLDAGLPPERVADLWHETQGVTVSEPVTMPQPVREAALPPAPPAALAATLASNAWTVAPARSATGGALLANDPHLGYQTPILWYLARLETPDWQVSGATVPGVPFHLIGHNGRIGWGITTTHADTKDLFIETVTGDGTAYLAPDGPRPFETREEVIEVRGGEPVTFTVRETRHGPVVTDLRGMAGVAGGTDVVALAATGLMEGDRTAEAIMRLNRAGNRAEFLEAMRLFHAPMQNVFFAATDGDTGFISAGRVPVRKAGDGRVPVPGAGGSHDWTGFVPFEDLPQAFAPASGTLLNANNRVVGDGYPHLITAHWPPPWRALRGEALLAGREAHTVADMIAMQHDMRSTMAETLVPVLLGALPASPDTAEARRRLEAWDGTMDPDRPEPLILSAWLPRIEKALTADELGDRAGDWRENGERFIAAVVSSRDTWWCDRKDTGASETCGDILDLSLSDALTDLRARHGEDMDGWRWGDVHEAALDNRLYGRIPLIGGWFNLRPEVGGGNHTLLRAGYWNGGESGRFDAVHGAGLRMVLDMADPGASRFIIATGQSENPLSDHYADQMPLWSRGATLTLDGEPASVLRLEP
ncbi:penicillin acylase like protein [Caenispirillum salinarum AK4]|uniref:Penicillin acylase like protein n=1 Tax=Caenispirillum salinarum AK4 TaxID=1238182 RepID=K9H086_9PROT|nr:penicillin acylase family protein [Caenispirillum salinarum]EKV31610.1 penicillin acylase like protein [Caenispirillum salinarum AK4]